MGWGNLKWSDHEEAAQELVFLWWLKNSIEADYVILDLERIRLGTLA